MNNEVNFFGLTQEKQTEILLSSSKLKQLVVEDIVESNEFYIAEMLKPFERYVGYQYGYGSYTNVWLKNSSLENARNFVEGLIEANGSYGLLDDEKASFAKEVLKKIDELQDKAHDSEFDDEAYEKLEEMMFADCKSLLKDIETQIDSIYESADDEEYQVEYFHDFYKHERMDEHEFTFNLDENRLYRTEKYQMN